MPCTRHAAKYMGAQELRTFQHASLYMHVQLHAFEESIKAVGNRSSVCDHQTAEQELVLVSCANQSAAGRHLQPASWQAV